MHGMGFCNKTKTGIGIYRGNGCFLIEQAMTNRIGAGAAMLGSHMARLGHKWGDLYGVTQDMYVFCCHRFEIEKVYLTPLFICGCQAGIDGNPTCTHGRNNAKDVCDCVFKLKMHFFCSISTATRVFCG